MMGNALKKMERKLEARKKNYKETRDWLSRNNRASALAGIKEPGSQNRHKQR